MCTEGAREHLGKHLKRFAFKYSIDQKDSSLSHEKVLFFFVERIFFPVMLVGVGLVTGVDIYFYLKYHNTSSYNDKKFLYLFPIPCVAPSFFVVNLVMSVVTAIRLFYWDKVKDFCNELIKARGNDKGCCDDLKNSCEILRKHCNKPLETKEKDKSRRSEETQPLQEMNNESNSSGESKQECNKSQKFLIFATLVLLFGVVYLFYHGLWIIIALLVYPGRILLGGIFVVPLILVVIPIWNTIIKIATNCYDASNCCKRCQTCNCCLCIIYLCIYCCLCITYPCTRHCCKHHKNYNPDQENTENQQDQEDTESKCKWKPFCNGILWLVILAYEIVFWGLFITILILTSKFLLGSIKIQEQTIQLALSYIAIIAISGILAWLNMDLVIDQQDKDENKRGQQQNKDENKRGQQQNNENKDENKGGQHQNNENNDENQGGQQQDNENNDNSQVEIPVDIHMIN